MMRKIVGTLFCALLLNASDTSSTITLDEAINMLKSQNLEIKAANLQIDAAKAEANSVSRSNFGKLDIIQDTVNSNDAGNVFGFKLASREATFGDFGFNEFLTPLGNAIYGASQGTPPSDMSSLLTTAPNDLNHPEARTFFKTKLKYELASG
jgi:hypothetical protein